MTTQERLFRLDKMRQEYETPISDERRVEIVEQVVVWAGEEPHMPKCQVCTKGMAYIPDSRPRCEGHVYTHAGMVDATTITGVCEWCFDKSSLPPDDQRRADWFGLEVYKDGETTESDSEGDQAGPEGSSEDRS